MVEALVGVFGSIPDPRRGNAVRHRLDEVLAMAVIASLCDCCRYTEMEMFCREREAWLRGFMELPGGVPSHDTFGDVLAAVDAAAIEGAFAGWAASVAAGSDLGVVAIDGKVSRRAHGAGAGGPDTVSAYACGCRLVLGQAACDDKSNEITAIPRLLAMLKLKGALVTIDAMGTQKEIAKAIVAKGADYVLTVKGNQPSLLEDIELFFADQPSGTELSFASTLEKSHGRVDARECASSGDAAWLRERHPGWESVAGIGKVTSVRGGEEAAHYLIFSRAGMAAAELLDAKRAHWGVENGLHWVLDMDFREDEARMRTGNAAKNMAAIRRICINLLRSENSFPKLSINLRRKKCVLSEAYLEKVLGLS